MKIVLQRVTNASVTVDDQVVGQIDHGLLALVGIAQGDSAATVTQLAAKTATLRIFADGEGRMNRNVSDVAGSILAVSQFTLLADTRRGRRPAFTDAAEPSIAKTLYQQFCQDLRDQSVPVQTGIFAADMQVRLTNDGPVTIILEL